MTATRKKILAKLIDADGSVFNKEYIYRMRHLIGIIIRFQLLSPFSQAEIERFSAVNYQELLNDSQKKIFENLVQRPYSLTLSTKERLHLHLSLNMETIDSELDDLLPRILTEAQNVFSLMNSFRKKHLNLCEEKVLNSYMHRFLTQLEIQANYILEEIFYTSNKNFLAKISLQMQNYDALLLISGSNRQDASLDEKGSVDNTTQAFLLVLDRLQKYLAPKFPDKNIIYQKFSMADICEEQPYGTTINAILNGEKKNLKSLTDVSKFALLYAVAHSLVMEYSNSEILLEFSDDLIELLRNLEKQFTDYPQALPRANLGLTLNRYKNGKYTDEFSKIFRGTGKVDEDYAATVRDMFAKCTQTIRELYNKPIEDGAAIPEFCGLDVTTHLNLGAYFFNRGLPSISMLNSFERHDTRMPQETTETPDSPDVRGLEYNLR